MSEMTGYAPGTFCWPELVAKDADIAKGFYSKLFGWSYTDVPIGDDKVYTMASLSGKEVGAMYQMWDEQEERGVPTHWASYVSVSNVDESVKETKSLGGEVIVGPMDVFDAGRMAMILDPAGAALSLWQPVKHIGARIVNEHGALCWNELMTNDTGKAGAFYTGLFGWTAQEHDMGGMIYTVFMNGGKPAAGMMKIDENRGDVPPSWLVYFAVNDCDAFVDQARSLGGGICKVPMDIPGVGRFAVMTDPQEAVFAVIQLEPM
ncbi:MAG: VOC family protein [Thermodesulfobacteriota bacterium]